MVNEHHYSWCMYTYATKQYHSLVMEKPVTLQCTSEDTPILYVQTQKVPMIKSGQSCNLSSRTEEGTKRESVYFFWDI